MKNSIEKAVNVSIMIGIIMIFIWALIVGCIVSSDKAHERVIECIIEIRNEEMQNYVKEYNEKIVQAKNNVTIDIWDNMGGDALTYFDITEISYDKNSGRTYYLVNYTIFTTVKYQSLYMYDLRNDKLINIHHSWSRRGPRYIGSSPFAFSRHQQGVL